jgi:plasmid stabilization system protein ParE
VSTPRTAFSQQAKADLKDLSHFIADRSGKQRSLLVLSRIDRTLQITARHPRIGRPRSFLPPGVLGFSLPPWLISYRILPDNEGIRVVRIVDSRRDLSALFGEKS